MNPNTLDELYGCTIVNNIFEPYLIRLTDTNFTSHTSSSFPREEILNCQFIRWLVSFITFSPFCRVDKQWPLLKFQILISPLIAAVTNLNEKEQWKIRMTTRTFDYKTMPTYLLPDESISAAVIQESPWTEANSKTHSPVTTFHTFTS